jgi:hypothetical protein
MERKVHYRIHNSPSPVPILSQLNPVHAPIPISLRSILILSSHLRLGLSNGLLPSGVDCCVVSLSRNVVPSSVLKIDHLAKFLFMKLEDLPNSWTGYGPQLNEVIQWHNFFTLSIF